MRTHDSSRRRFLGVAAIVAAAPIALRALPANAAGLPMLPVDAPNAKALHYTENATTAKNPAYKPGSDCGNCNFYKGGASSGGCALFPKNDVAAAGWCSAWVAKK